ncbi:MAG: Xaa-Pro dipeptidase [Halomonas sp.]|nr:Xaa-Pro dipeptidase [Halomonas sp.]MDN6296474.1 Xaa-Pro dipeptidase [Halomonas sp.]MDN6313827.1 Xaa-Pro dipeptidase [Halomonas sp.]MDN6335281.1 Xaa-Pro dipeptidase [Halomonas sp.]
MSETLHRLQQAHIHQLLGAYRTLMQQHGLDAIALYSGHALPHYGDDQYPEFQAAGHFVHLVPLSEAQHSWLIITPAERPRLMLYAPTDFWHLSPELPDEPWVSEFNIELVNEAATPSLSGRIALIGDVEGLQESPVAPPHGDANSPTLVGALDELRMYKSAYEISCLREANRLAKAGHEAAQAAFAGASSELDIQLAYLGASRQRESHVPYDNIIGLNQHAGVLHYQHYDIHTPGERHSLLVDAGRRFRGYCADITRTWAGPDAPAPFSELIDAMHALKDHLIDDMAPGVDYLDLHLAMHRRLGAILVEHDLYHGTVDACVESGVTRAFCPHGVGHSLGIQVHDVAGLKAPDGTPAPAPADHPALRLTRKLTPGMVVTIEPGLYFIPMLLDPLRDTDAPINWALVDQLMPCGGIRIEDNVAVTEQGFDNLTP